MAIAKSSYTNAYRLLFVVSIIDGVSGSMTGSMLIGQAYVADCSLPVNRASSFGLLRAVLFAGISLGPITAGLIIGQTGSLLSVFYFSAMLHVCNILYIAFLLPESLSREARDHASHAQSQESELVFSQALDWRSFINRINFLKPLKALWPADGTRMVIKRNIAILSIIETFFHGTELGVILNLLLYAELTFKWTSVTTGIFISLASFARAFALVILLPLLLRCHRRWKPHTLHEVGASKGDVFLIRFSFVFYIAAYVVMVLSRNSTEFFLGMIHCLQKKTIIIKPKMVANTLT